MAPGLDALTEDHAAVYDRQLRVWGVEVQRRLMEAKVLIIGLGGLAAEIAKNIVLAGVGTVALRDDTPATAAAPGNFLVEPGAAAAGKTVAEASAATLQAMNPLMAVRVEPGSASVEVLLSRETAQGQEGDQAAEALRGLVSRYDLLVAVGLPLRQLEALDALCGRLGKQLFGGAVRGASSFVFVNLGPRHTFTVKSEAGEKVVEYCSFRQAMSADLATVNKRTHPLYLVLRACWQFEEAHGRAAAGGADVSAVREAAEQLAAATALGRTAASPAAAAQALLPEGLLEGFVVDAPVTPGTSGSAAATAEEEEAGEVVSLGEVATVSAVVGGVVANNVLRAVSYVNPPLCNLFCYSYLARDGLGVEECFL